MASRPWFIKTIISSCFVSDCGWHYQSEVHSSCFHILLANLIRNLDSLVGHATKLQSLLRQYRILILHLKQKCLLDSPRKLCGAHHTQKSGARANRPTLTKLSNSNTTKTICDQFMVRKSVFTVDSYGGLKTSCWFAFTWRTVKSVAWYWSLCQQADERFCFPDDSNKSLPAGWLVGWRASSLTFNDQHQHVRRHPVRITSTSCFFLQTKTTTIFNKNQLRPRLLIPFNRLYITVFFFDKSPWRIFFLANSWILTFSPRRRRKKISLSWWMMMARVYMHAGSSGPCMVCKLGCGDVDELNWTSFRYLIDNGDQGKECVWWPVFEKFHVWNNGHLLLFYCRQGRHKSLVASSTIGIHNLKWWWWL